MKKRMLSLTALILSVSFTSQAQETIVQPKHEVGIGLESASHHYASVQLSYRRLLPNFNLRGIVNIGLNETWGYAPNYNYYYRFDRPEPLSQPDGNGEFIGKEYYYSQKSNQVRLRIGIDKDLKLAKNLDLRIGVDLVTGYHKQQSTGNIGLYQLDSTYKGSDPIYKPELYYFANKKEDINSETFTKHHLIYGALGNLGFMFNINNHLTFHTTISYQLANASVFKEDKSYENENSKEYFTNYSTLGPWFSGAGLELGLNYKF